MPANLTPEQTKRFIESVSFAHIATTNKDGSPQVSPVWIEHDGAHIVVNSEQSRLKVRNVKRDPRVAISIQDPENPYAYIQIKGKVVEITPKGGADGIDRLAKKYMGQDTYPFNQPGDVRVQIKVAPEKVFQM
jgi:PPOX class probable F420-dependent enzyme